MLFESLMLKAITITINAIITTAMDGYEDEDIDEEDLDDMELEDDEEDILYDDLEEDIDEEVSDDAVPYQSSTTKDLPEEYNESEELELEEIDDK